MQRPSSIVYSSPIGAVEIEGSELGVQSVKFVSKNLVQANASLEELPEPIQNCYQQIDEYFNRKRENFDVSFDLKGSLFQKKVWRELLHIPYGKTVSYKFIAKAIGDEKASQAVGNANGKNRLAVIIPCHRVIGSNGSLVGYAGGLQRKRWLLDFERSAYQGSLF